MTDKAWRAFVVFRDIGPQRTIDQAAELLGYSSNNNTTLARWSTRYNWVRLCTEHDHRELRQALGQRNVIRERATQELVDALPIAIQTMLNIMLDQTKIPILNRDGSPMTDPDGNQLFRFVVRASTRLDAAKTVSAIAGLVPVKRMEVKDTSGETLDEAAGLIKSLTPQQVEAVIEAVAKDDAD